MEYYFQGLGSEIATSVQQVFSFFVHVCTGQPGWVYFIAGAAVSAAFGNLRLKNG